MILFDKLSQRGVKQQDVQPKSNMVSTQIKSKPLTTTPISQRINNIPERGVMGSMPDWAHEKRQFIHDLPSKVQLQGIQDILSGKDTPSPIINNFVKGMAAQGKSPEEIRQAFLEHQKGSDNPLVMM